MADVPETDEGTSGPLAWLLAIPVVLFVLVLPAIVVTAILLTVFLAVDAVVGLPAVTVGALEATGVPADYVLPLVLSVGLGVLVSLGLVARNGFDWEGTDGSPTYRNRGP